MLWESYKAVRVERPPEHPTSSLHQASTQRVLRIQIFTKLMVELMQIQSKALLFLFELANSPIDSRAVVPTDYGCGHIVPHGST